MIASNYIIYSPIVFLDTLKNIIENNSANQTKKDLNEETLKVFAAIDLIYAAILPFIMMLIFSNLLIHTLLKSRLRIIRLTNQHDRNRLRKVIQFAISSILMNFFYLFSYLPEIIYMFLKNDVFTDLYFNFLFFLQY